ncbi:hypothetical protein Taro_043562 [Colocasia esculenta]|uniref:beta-aspartyl-peptidase n=1 Tax=Colocasia esculenta TaxID=4460 RepID=A0A843WRR1_COLES|nr:hypothetical protein [Colocasia esculenta]
MSSSRRQRELFWRLGEFVGCRPALVLCRPTVPVLKTAVLGAGSNVDLLWCCVDLLSPILKTVVLGTSSGYELSLVSSNVYPGNIGRWAEFVEAFLETVGPGGSPDENGETTIDALIMNGTTLEVGAVAAMRYVKDGIRAAKLVLEHTRHTLLVGEQASIFAISMGLVGPTDLSSPDSVMKWKKWKENSCQPNFRKNVVPMNGCGPYHPDSSTAAIEDKCSGNDILGTFASNSRTISRNNHDTISMAVIDKAGHIAVGTSTNGATFKIPGRSDSWLLSYKQRRFLFISNIIIVLHQFTKETFNSRVGDGPIAGSSAYADDEVGACGATGDGDVMMRFLPCYQVVESMRQGMEPKDAAADAISRIARKYPDFVGAVFAINKNGEHAGACHGWRFQYSVRTSMKDVEVFTVVP